MDTGSAATGLLSLFTSPLKHMLYLPRRFPLMSRRLYNYFTSLVKCTTGETDQAATLRKCSSDATHLAHTCLWRNTTPLRRSAAKRRKEFLSRVCLGVFSFSLVCCLARRILASSASEACCQAHPSGLGAINTKHLSRPAPARTSAPSRSQAVLT
jgi:hypothetical protein